MKIMVVGGTHLGIKGRYGKRTFEIESLDQLESVIRKDRELPNAIKDSYTTRSGKIVHTLTDKKGLTLFEYYVESIL